MVTDQQLSVYLQTFIARIRDTTLVFNTTNNGRRVRIQYRPAVALTAGERSKPSTPAETATAIANFIGELVAGLKVNGRAVAVSGRSGPTDEAIQMVGAVMPALLTHAFRWAAQQSINGSPAHQAAVREASTVR